MGNGNSAAPASASHPRQIQRAGSIRDNYGSLDELKRDLRRKGLESSNLILGIDFTKSNEWTGKRTFRGKCLHDVNTAERNPYEQVMETISKTLYEYDDDNTIPVYGFGDDSTGDTAVFSFMPLQPQGAPVFSGYRLGDVRNRYRDAVPHVTMAGPTTFAPIIYQAVRLVQQNNMAYHILVIIADGQVTRSVDVPQGAFSKHEQETINAINFASNFPLSIVVVGVGDGPWDMMHIFDDELTNRRFDNFQFVDFDAVTRGISDPKRRETQFALHALMEIPEQFQLVRQLNLMSSNGLRVQVPSVTVLPAPFLELGPTSYPGAPLSYPGPSMYPGPSAFPGPPNSAPAAYPGSAMPTYPGGSSVPPAFPVATGKTVPAYVPSAPMPAPVVGNQKACPVCTYLNAASATACEVCTTPLLPGASERSPADARLVENMRALHEAQLCPICEDHKKDMVFQCGHETCRACSEQLSLCPICRVPITTRIRRYG
ncbi:E3 ubiquitin-protein ligase RGLG2 [Achlya hypogyna]|uniref:E3 ubiquitin-protein ligase RGLG2 n=1 Tax=Achlya hypogyna TaxID=1202772 RepID=A0A1V9YCF2_ACHHY|nr:E3 ubiquitin-protein ligase RGLG2 [Achlya hypogyna]